MEILLPSNQSIFYKATKRTLPNPEQAKALSSLQTSVWLLGALRIKSKLLHTTSIQGTSSPGLSSLSGLTFSLSLPSTYPMLFFNLILSSLTANNLHALFANSFSSNLEFTLQALAYITSSGGGPFLQMADGALHPLCLYVSSPCFYLIIIVIILISTDTKSPGGKRLCSFSTVATECLAQNLAHHRAQRMFD